MAHADNGDPFHRLVRAFFLALLISLVGQIGQQLFQICLGGDPVHRHDLHHTAIQFSVPHIALGECLDLQSRDQKIPGLHRIAEEIIIVHIIDFKAGVFHAFLWCRSLLRFSDILAAIHLVGYFLRHKGKLCGHLIADFFFLWFQFFSDR